MFKIINYDERINVEFSTASYDFPNCVCFFYCSKLGFGYL